MVCIWSYFRKGKTHDLYGLLILIVLSIVMVMTQHNLTTMAFSLISLIVSVGVFVDLWAHCFHH
ncbi:MAG: hypothetical protein QXF40_01085 [Metallosphaera sp.]